MAEARLKLEPEVQEIFQCIDVQRNFLLSGGAGSGKTYSLVQVIRQVIAEKSNAKVACMTYTNAAVKEIEERVDHDNLTVSTIHDFMWDNIKYFQKELRVALVALANSEDSDISIDAPSPIPNDYFDELENGIQYKEFVRLKDGIISHDELLVVANYLFTNYAKLSSIVKDRYQYIFVDEYQDTNLAVVDIFLNQFKKSGKINVIGFFGDSMQSIYDDGVGDLNAFKGEAPETVKEIMKSQNRRSPGRVIDLANKLRTDGIVQKPSDDLNAPNMQDGLVKAGTVMFFYSTSPDLVVVRKYLTEKAGWKFEDAKNTKELNLTHNLIAGKAGFGALMEIYDDDPVIKLKNDIVKKIKDNKKGGKPAIELAEQDSFDVVVDKFKLVNKGKQLKKEVLLQNPIHVELYDRLKDKPFEEVRKIYLSKDSLVDDKKQGQDEESKKGSKRDALIKHLFKIQNCITLYKNGHFNDFLRVTDYKEKLNSIEAKRILNKNIEALVNAQHKTIGEIIHLAHDYGICCIDDRLEAFKQKSEYLYKRVTNVAYKEFQLMYDYLEGKTPFSTQHKTKGTEFDNVLVVLDNGGWTKYSFENMFLNTGTESVLIRTKKLFYVCCTRSKENLAIFYHNPSDSVIAVAKQWFGEDSVISV